MSKDVAPKSSLPRRQFLKNAATGAAVAAAAIAAPRVVTASRTSEAITLGEGDYRYEVQHASPQLPDEYHWQTTHGVAVDSQGQLYVIQQGNGGMREHPAIFVFDSEGVFVRAFGEQFQGGGHGIEVRQEGSEEFLYISAYRNARALVKMTLTGEEVWRHSTPTESGLYGQRAFQPTNIAFLEGGDFFLADGYGANYIHRYDNQGNWISYFGGRGPGNGTFHTPHGLWVDNRGGRDPVLVVTDRAHHTLQRLTLEGEHLETLEGYGLPANIDTRGDLMLVPELHARITILDGENQVVARLGDDVERVTADGDRQIRRSPDQWLEGKFVHPHDACFDHEGNIYVAEWVATGRVTKLRHVG